MRRLALPGLFGLLITALVPVHAQLGIPIYSEVQPVNVAPTTPHLTAVDPYAYPVSTDVMPARPFLYTVDKNGITVTRFNDNQVVGTWPWPKDVIYTVTPDGGFIGLTPPVQWEPVAITVSYPTAAEFANRGLISTGTKPIPDLTPPPTFVYVVMAHSGYKWVSNGGVFRESIVPTTDLSTDSSLLVQINVSDPSFSAAADPANPVPPHIAAALLGQGAGQLAYDRGTGNVYVGNMPSLSLPQNLRDFVFIVRRIPDTVAETEAEVPGISVPVIRCGPQHPESGIPLNRPQAYACYDPSGVHPLDDNEHVGAYGNFDWQFRNLPAWLHVGRAVDCPAGTAVGVTCSKDGILYGTPLATGDFVAEARVHNLDDEYGIFSDWTPVFLLVTPTAEYLPIRAEFAAGVPVAYPLEGTGSCQLDGAPLWVESVTVPNGCVIMGKAPLDGQHYSFSMPGFVPTPVPGYANPSLVFSGSVFGEYGFIPLPTGVGISGLAYHQVSKVADPSTESAVLSLEYIGVQPSTGQLYRILPPPGRPQPPNERPPETVLTLPVVTPLGAPLKNNLSSAVMFGQVAVEADRDIFVAAQTNTADGAVVKVSGSTPTVIPLTGLQPSYLDLDSDLRTAILGVEPGQVDHGALWVTGNTGSAVVIDTTAATVAQEVPVANTPSVGNVSLDFGTRYAYVADGSTGSVATLAPQGVFRPEMRARIWSAEEFTWNLGQEAEVQVMSTGDIVPALTLEGNLPPGLTFTNNGDGTATIRGTPTAPSGGEGGELDVEGGDYAMVLTATGWQKPFAQSFGITVQSPPTITSGNTATFVAGAASSFTVTGLGWPTPIFYVWDTVKLPDGVLLIDNEDGTASLRGIAQTPGTYTFDLHATTDAPPDATQSFTLTVLAAGNNLLPAFNSADNVTWEAVGAPFSPDVFTVSTIGAPTPTLSIVGQLPPGVTFVDNGNGTGSLGAACMISWPGMAPSCLGLIPPGSSGSYPFTIRATNAAGTTDQAFTMVLEVCDSIMAASPATLSFLTDGTFDPSAAVSLTTMGATLPFSLVTTENWLSADVMGGTLPTNITVTANAAGLAPGTYTATVIINSAGTEGPPATVEVTLTVLPLGQPGLLHTWPAALNFEYNAANGVMPAPQKLWVMSGGANTPFTVSTGNAKWLKVNSVNGTAPGSFSVSVDPKVGAGTHIGAVTMTPLDANSAPLSVPVILYKVANSDLFRIMFDVGASPEGLSVNLNTHDLFISSSNAGAETAEGGAETGGGAETAGPPEPSAVFQVDPVNKKVIGIANVHSEGEYVAVNSKTGRAYHASQGTGEVAVIDGATNQVITFIPLMIKTAVYQPYQIAVDQGRNIIYVGAKAPSIPDPVMVNGKLSCPATHEMPDDEYDCWNPGSVFVIDGNTNKIVGSFVAGDDPEGVVFAAKTNKVFASNEDDGSVTVASAAVRNTNGTITLPKVLYTIIKGIPVPGQWKPNCDPATNYCGERGDAALWPTKSACNGLDDEAEEADKMSVDENGNVYIIDDRYRVAKINGVNLKVEKVLAIPGYDCELDVPDGSTTVFRNTANNIAFMTGKKKLYVTSEQNTLSIIDPSLMTIKSTIRIPGAVELDAITTDPSLNSVYITDEDLSALWILKGACANGTAKACVDPTLNQK